MVTKGALEKVPEICAPAELSEDELKDLQDVYADIQRLYEEQSRQGLRVLGVAYRRMGDETTISTDDEREMTFAGLLVFHDPPSRGSRRRCGDCITWG
ncbi:hypothetical protein [Candidatus Solincola sp.]|nr:hypothetical protein [Actinomycetota bacterium]MDI7253322.1 hypothetical protein [Actinomycetota bacterium]